MAAQPIAIHAVAARGLRVAAARIAAKIDALVRHGEAWRIAWRPAGLTRLPAAGWPQSDYRVLPDDGRRYFADPFVFVHRGTTYVFCEEFPYATGVGIISVFTVTPDGTMSAPRPVVQAPCHLSYPHIFEEGGTIYMIPETAAARTIELWRAEAFPDRWVRETVLVDNIAAADTSLCAHNGRLWLLTSVSTDGASDWDTLSLFSADRLHGPWQAHPGNPVVVDARAARSAGAIFRQGGSLWRPVQDCSAGYGSGLAFATIDTLGPDSFAQTVRQTFTPPAAWRVSGIHTFNVGGGLEVIDVMCRPTLRLPGVRPRH
jgi:hypothetical protein